MNKYILVSHNCPTTGINYKQDSLTAAETVSGKQGQHASGSLHASRGSSTTWKQRDEESLTGVSHLNTPGRIGTDRK